MGRQLVLLFLLGFTFSVQAQMTDLIGSMAIQGQMSASGLKGYGTASIMHKKNSLMQELQIQVIDIKTKYMNNYQNVSRETLQSPLLKKYKTTLHNNGNSFYFELHNMDQKLCKSLSNNFAGAYKIDNNNCQNVKIYFK
jgi:hypothetical protein